MWLVLIFQACFYMLTWTMGNDITMILKHRLTELMVQVTPILYQKYISVDCKERAALYVKMKKAMYKCTGYSGVPDCSTGN